MWDLFLGSVHVGAGHGVGWQGQKRASAHWFLDRNRCQRAALRPCGRLAPCASARMEPYHDRMPVLVEAKDSDSWLDGSLGVGALKPAPEEALRERTVSLRLNRSRVGDDNPTIIAPIRAD